MKRLYAFLTRKSVLAVNFAILSILLFVLLEKSIQGTDWGILKDHLLALGLCLLLSFSFIAVSSWQWKIACSAQNVRFTYKESLSMTLRCALIDLLIFPSKISSDVYRATYLHEHGLKESVKIIFLYRAGKIAPFLILLPFALLQMGLNPLWPALTLLAILAALIFYSQKLKALAPPWRPLSQLIILASVLIFTESIRTWILLSIFNVLPFKTVATSYLFSQTAGTLSGIPLGLGAKDLSWGLQLKNWLTASQLASFLLLLRLTGEIFGALVGWSLFGKKVMQWLRERRSQ